MKQQPSETLWRDVPFLNISYGELLIETSGFCSEYLIGIGGFSLVYRGIHEPLQLSMAVKVFNLERKGASKSFMAECETLRKIRHLNLVKIITACSSVNFQGNDFKALVYEFMSNGSLDDWLHRYPQTGESQRRSLKLAQRLNIVIDVASALDYLHNHSKLPVIHCDLKPSNILLGLSRIMAEDDTQGSQNHTRFLGIRGTIGYMALEHGKGSKVSTKGDVFSFGILLLEIFIGKKPTNEDLDGVSLHQFAKMALPTKVMEIVDQHLLIEGEEEAYCNDRVHECFISIFTIGLMCSEELPRERMKINDILKNLQKIKKICFSNMQGTITEPEILKC